MKEKRKRQSLSGAREGLMVQEPGCPSPGPGNGQGLRLFQRRPPTSYQRRKEQGSAGLVHLLQPATLRMEPRKHQGAGTSWPLFPACPLAGWVPLPRAQGCVPSVCARPGAATAFPSGPSSFPWRAPHLPLARAEAIRDWVFGPHWP